MARLVRRAATAVFVVLAALAVASTAAPAALAEPAPQPPSPADVEIPYLGDAAIEPAPPWLIADCAAVAAASPLVTGCDATRVTLVAPEYDPDAEVQVIPVALTNGAVSTTVGYRVTLMGPDVPAVRPAEAPWPVAAGSLFRVPISDLGIECEVCAAGGRLEALEVKPTSAGAAWATPTHLVFRASAGYSGEAEIGYRFADDYGTWSAGAAVHAAVYPPSVDPLVTFDLVVPTAADGTASVELSTLVASIADEEVLLVGCGAAMHGRVACDEDVASYSGAPGVPDQFSVQFAAGGEQATASVTLVPEGSERRTGPAAIAPPPDQADGVTTWFVPPVPVDHHDTSGIFSPLVATLDRVGAR